MAATQQYPAVQHTEGEERHHQNESSTELSRQLLQSQEDERRRIARDLHDGTGQDLAGLQISLTLARREAPESSAKLQEILSECEMLAQKLSGEIRTLCCLLHPPWIEIGGLGPAIVAYAEALNRRNSIYIEVEIPPNLPRLPDDAEIALFRVVQAAFTNVFVHSGTKAARIKIEHTSKTLTLTVKDEGRGMPLEVLNHIRRSDHAGVGIAGMSERVKGLGGRLEFETSENGPEHGTSVKVTIPSRNFRR